MEKLMWHEAIPNTPIQGKRIEADFQNAFDHLAEKASDILHVKKEMRMQEELRKLAYESLLMKKEKLLSRLKNAIFQSEQSRLWTYVTRIAMRSSESMISREGCQLDGMLNQLFLLDQQIDVVPTIQKNTWTNQNPNSQVFVNSSLDYAFDQLLTTAAILQIENPIVEKEQCTWSIEFNSPIVCNWIELHLQIGIFGEIHLKSYFNNEMTSWQKKMIHQKMAWHRETIELDRIELEFDLKQPLYNGFVYRWIIQILEMRFFQKKFYNEGTLLIGPIAQSSAAEQYYVDAEGEFLDQLSFEIAYRKENPIDEDFQMIDFRKPFARHVINSNLIVGTGTIQENNSNDFSIQFHDRIENLKNTKGFELFYGIWQWKCEKTTLAFSNRQPTMALWDFLWQNQPNQIRTYHSSIVQPIPFLSNQDPIRDGNCFRFQTNIYCDDEKELIWKNPLYDLRDQLLWTIILNQENYLLQQSEYRFLLKKGWNECIILIHFNGNSEDVTLGFDQLDLGKWVHSSITDARAIRNEMKIKNVSEWQKETSESLRHSVFFDREKWFVKFRYADVRFGLHQIQQATNHDQFVWLRIRLTANKTNDCTPMLDAIELREMR